MDGIRKKIGLSFSGPFGDSLDHAKLLFTKLLLLLCLLFRPKNKRNVVSAAVDGKELKPEFNHPEGNILAS